LVDFATRNEARPVPAADGANLLVDWGEPDARMTLASFLRVGPREAEDVAFTGDPGSAGFTNVSKTLLGNRFDTALVLDTPRKTTAYWRFFNLMHTGVPWYGRRPEGAFRNNLCTPLQARSDYEIFNSYTSRIPIPISKLKEELESTAQYATGPYTDATTYTPVMFDIGNSILNIADAVSSHVSGKLRAHIKMESISYMEASSLLMQMADISSNRASSIGPFTATLNNAAASQAFEPVVGALACAFTKISVDLPTNARQSTVMQVVTLMTYTSVIYDNSTKALLHNMFVGMVMPTSSGLHGADSIKESSIDFGLIRRSSSEHKLLPTPPLMNKDYSPQSLKLRDSMIRLLCHYHGVQCLEGAEVKPMSMSPVWSSRGSGFVTAGPAGGAPPIAIPTYYDQYFHQMGRVDTRTITEEHYLHGLVVSPDANPTRVAPTLVASSVDHMVHKDADARRERARRTMVGVEFKISTFTATDFPGAMSHGMKVRIVGWTMFNDIYYIVIRLNPEDPLTEGFEDDVIYRPEVIYPRLSISLQKEITFSMDPMIGDYVTPPKVYLADPASVSFLTEPVDSVLKLRPKLPTLLPVRGYSDESGSMSEGLKDFVGRVLLPILNGVSTVGEKQYVGTLAMQVFNQRWAWFMDYITSAASITMLADYSPFGFNPMIIPADLQIDMRDPTQHRRPLENPRVCAFGPLDTQLVRGTPMMFLSQTAGDVNPNVPHWRYEPEVHHRKVPLDPSALVALALLGVAPAEPPDISGALDLNLDSKAFNHDVAMMRVAARMFVDIYSPRLYTSQARFKALGSDYKLGKFNEVLSRIRAMFPPLSVLTKKVEASLTQFELRQNHFWRGSPYIDADFPEALAADFDPRCSFQLPYLRHRPLTPMCDSNYNGGVNFGLQDTFFHQVMSVCDPYREHKLSSQDTSYQVLVCPSRLVRRDYALTRVNMVANVPRPLGLPYTLPAYHSSPIIECNWLYFTDLDPRIPIYSVPDALRGKLVDPIRRMPDGAAFIAGISPSRTHAMVYREWLYKQRLLTGVTQLEHVIYNPHGYSVDWSQAGDINCQVEVPSIPELVDYTLPATRVTVSYTTPDMYVGKAQQVMDAIGYTSECRAVLRTDQGPMISRMSARSYAWPADTDYTQRGSLTENMLSDTTEIEFPNSCEYNVQMIGIVPTRVKPFVMVDPTSMLVLVKDPIATWSRA